MAPKEAGQALGMPPLQNDAETARLPRAVTPLYGVCVPRTHVRRAEWPEVGQRGVISGSERIRIGARDRLNDAVMWLLSR